MAEAAMMALAPTLGRGAAHDAVYDACRTGRPLAETFGITLDPAQYLGESEAIVGAALSAWEAGTARP
jgi:hypothetical protein